MVCRSRVFWWGGGFPWSNCYFEIGGLLDIPRFYKESIRSSFGWSVMGKLIDLCYWFVGGWERNVLAAILPAAGVVSGPTTLSEFGKSFEIH